MTSTTMTIPTKKSHNQATMTKSQSIKLELSISMINDVSSPYFI